MSRKLKVALTTLFFFACLVVCDAQSKEPDDVVVWIALPAESICTDTKSLTLERFITNVGSRELSISRDWVLKRREFEVVFDIKERFGRIAELETRSDPISDFDLGRTSLKLKAGAAARYKTTLELDNQFFQKPGFYKMRMHYLGAIREPSGAFREVLISSNWVLFEVESCASKPAK